MKWKISTLLLLGLTIILCFNLFRQKQEISKLNATPKVIGKTDTVYVTKEFKYIPNYNTQVLPNKLLLYGNNWEGKKVQDNTSNDSTKIHREDSLVQLLLSKENLSLSFYNSQAEGFLTKEFKLDLGNYKYNWLNGTLTQEKIKQKLKLQPYTYAKYRPIHKMIDLGLGIQLQKNHYQFKLGLVGFYYPSLQDKLGTDLEFTFTYNY